MVESKEYHTDTTGKPACYIRRRNW